MQLARSLGFSDQKAYNVGNVFSFPFDLVEALDVFQHFGRSRDLHRHTRIFVCLFSCFDFGHRGGDSQSNNVPVVLGREGSLFCVASSQRNSAHPKGTTSGRPSGQEPNERTLHGGRGQPKVALRSAHLALSVPPKKTNRTWAMIRVDPSSSDCFV